MTEDKKLSERLLGGIPDTDWFKVDTDSFIGMCKEIADLEQQNADLQRRWDSFTSEQKAAIANSADESADTEEWD